MSTWICCAHWLIPPQVCTAGGTYIAANSGGAAEKHTAATGHPTVSRWVR